MEIALLRNWLALDFRASLEDLLNKNKHKESYWLLVAAQRLEPKVFRTVFIMLSYCPAQMLDSMCYFVDNRIGKLERIWVNPADIPIPDWLLDFETKYAKHPEEEKCDKDIFESAKGMPIIYS